MVTKYSGVVLLLVVLINARGVGAAADKVFAVRRDDVACKHQGHCFL